MNFSSNIDNHNRNNYPELQNILENTINYLSYFSSQQKSAETICEKPEPHLGKSSTRSVIHTLIFNHRISNYEGAFYARSFFTISEKDPTGKPINPPKFIKENCDHGLNCPILIGTCLFIWISKKYELYLPPHYEDFGGCRFFHDHQDIGIVMKKVGDIMEKIYEKHSSNKQQDQQPIYRAMYNSYFFAMNHNDKKYPERSIRVFKLTNFNIEEIRDLKKRSKDIKIRIFDDNIFSVNNSFDASNAHVYIESLEKKIDGNYDFKNLSPDPYKFYIQSKIPDVRSKIIFPPLLKMEEQTSDEEEYENEEEPKKLVKNDVSDTESDFE